MNKQWIRRFGTLLTALWIFGGAFVYYVRITVTFYRAHKAAVHDAVTTIAERFGVSS